MPIQGILPILHKMLGVVSARLLYPRCRALVDMATDMLPPYTIASLCHNTPGRWKNSHPVPGSYVRSRHSTCKYSLQRLALVRSVFVMVYPGIALKSSIIILSPFRHNSKSGSLPSSVMLLCKSMLTDSIVPFFMLGT